MLLVFLFTLISVPSALGDCCPPTYFKTSIHAVYDSGIVEKEDAVYDGKKSIAVSTPQNSDSDVDYKIVDLTNWKLKTFLKSGTCRVRTLPLHYNVLGCIGQQSIVNSTVKNAILTGTVKLGDPCWAMSVDYNYQGNKAKVTYSQHVILSKAPIISNTTCDE